MDADREDGLIVGGDSPWGPITSVLLAAEDVAFVHTDRHAGYRIGGQCSSQSA